MAVQEGMWDIPHLLYLIVTQSFKAQQCSRRKLLIVLRSFLDPECQCRMARGKDTTHAWGLVAASLLHGLDALDL